MRDVTGVDSVRADTGYDGSGVHVAVVDSGIGATHPDITTVENNYQLAGNPIGSPTLWVLADLLDTDGVGHGTHCSGTIAGHGETDGGMAPGATLTGYSTGAAVSVLKSTAAYDHLLANHADDVDIVSNSYGAASAADFDPTLPQNVATKAAYDADLLSVFAMGNSGPGPDTMNDYAKAPWVLGVAATNDARAITNFSSRGRPGGAHDRQTALSNGTGIYRPAVAAPGNQVNSTMSPGDVLQATAADTDLFYAAISGTSMSAPAVSGIAALMYEAAGGAAVPLDVLLTIEATARSDSDYDAFNAGAGFVDAVTGRSSALERLVRMLTAFRYSRYDDSDPLEHEARADVFEVVEKTPGAYLSEVAEEADLPLSTVRHHVRVLEREDLLRGTKMRGKRRFYLAYTCDIELAAALNDDSTAVVLDALSRLDGPSVSELSDELGRDPSTVTHHLQRLEADDIVVREREGRAVINRLSAEARTALKPETEPQGAEAAGAVASD